MSGEAAHSPPHCSRFLLLSARVRLRNFAEHVRCWLAADWRGAKYVPFGVALLALTTLITVAYYANRPNLQLDPDTVAYVMDARRIASGGGLVDPARLPGYPLLIAFVFAVAGQGNLAAVSVAQAVLFVLAAVGLYGLLCMVLRSGGLAFLVAALAGANIQLLYQVKAILSEGLSLFLFVALALAVVSYIRHPRGWALWIVAVSMLALFMTRPEWMYLPIPLFAYLLVLAGRKGLLRRLLPHALAAALVLYGVAGLYIHANAVQYQCPTLTYVANINLLGKVMQYQMQDQAPAQYAGFIQVVDSYMARGDNDPWQVIQSRYPPLFPECYALFRDYSTTIIAHHPLEYLGKSLPIAGETLTETAPVSPVLPHGTFAGWLLALNAISEAIIRSLLVFPLLALLWWGLLFWQRTRNTLTVQVMSAVALLAFYGLALTSLGGYVYYSRLRTPYGPLLIVVVWGSAVVAARLGAQLGACWLRKRTALCIPASSALL